MKNISALNPTGAQSPLDPLHHPTSIIFGSALATASFNSNVYYSECTVEIGNAQKRDHRIPSPLNRTRQRVLRVMSPS